MFVNIMNEKILTCFITLLWIINREGSYVVYLIIYLFIFKCNYSLKWFLINLKEEKNYSNIGSGLMLAMSLLRYA